MKTTREQRRIMKNDIDRILDSLILINKMISNYQFYITKYSHSNERHNWEFKNNLQKWTQKINIEIVLSDDSYFLYYYENFDSAFRNINALEVEELFSYKIEINKFREQVVIHLNKVEDIAEVITILLEESEISL